MGRTVGVVSVPETAAPRALPRQADFSGNVWGQAFWLARAPELTHGPGTLMISSGATVLRDLAVELGLFGPHDGTTWTEGLLQRLRDALRGANVTPPDVIPTEGTVPVPWLRAALWFTYNREQFPGHITAVRLPMLTTLPTMARYLGAGADTTRAVTSYDPSLYSPDPFGVVQTDVQDVPTSTSSSSGSDLTLPVLLAIGLALAGGEGK